MQRAINIEPTVGYHARTIKKSSVATGVNFISILPTTTVQLETANFKHESSRPFF